MSFFQRRSSIVLNPLGGLSQDVTLGVTGVAGTSAIGSVSGAALATVALAGVVAVGLLGSAGKAPTLALSGVAATGAVGTVIPSNAHALTGVSASGAVGTLTLSRPVALSGVSATTGLGGFTSSGIAFDATSTSGYQAAQSSYSWSHTCAGTDRYLRVAISLLSNAGTVVTGVTFNGDALSFLGAQNAASGPLRVELWGVVAPDVGTFSIQVQFDGSLNSVAGADSFTWVDQATPTEGLAGATGLNGGAADATVDVTTVAAGDWVLDALATDDPTASVGSGQVERWNATGASGSGAGSTEGPKSPAGSVTMSWTGIGAGQRWVVAAIALRPVSFASGGSVSSTVALSGVSASGSVGTVTPSGGAGGNITLALTGVSATGAVGTLSKTTSVPLTGVSGTGAVGALVETQAPALVGVSATGAVGTLTTSRTVALSGVQGTGQVGTVSAGGTGAAALTGVQAAGSVGTVIPSRSVAISGVSGAGALGTVLPAKAVPLAGVVATGQVGTVVATGGVTGAVGHNNLQPFVTVNIWRRVT